MFDNLRDDASNSFYEEDDTELFPEENVVRTTTPTAPPRKPIGKIFGMTAIQRFIIAVMLMVAVCTLGAMCLLITGKIGLV
jgi:hypothetical protein